MAYIQTDMRLWDVFLYDGSEVLLLIALAIFKLLEEVRIHIPSALLASLTYCNSKELLPLQDAAEVTLHLGHAASNLFDCRSLIKVSIATYDLL